MNGGARLHVTGIVQGVGFRPFVFNLANRLGLSGWVRNTSAGVEIELDGPPEQIEAFVGGLRQDSPPLARIDEITISYGSAQGHAGFEIHESASLPEAFQPISPDVAVCADCVRELFDPADRRYRYPFINCTNCGPRFTIIKDIPYDRPLTTMAGFDLCPDCAREYADPADRRFHAQPVACPVCGPRIWLEPGTAGAEPQRLQGEDAIQSARRLLADGGILAVKGLGGFHLACDATNSVAVEELRKRKLRVDKPFAVMVPDVHEARTPVRCEHARAGNPGIIGEAHRATKAPRWIKHRSEHRSWFGTTRSNAAVHATSSPANGTGPGFPDRPGHDQR